jgi:hypothetical protein
MPGRCEEEIDGRLQTGQEGADAIHRFDHVIGGPDRFSLSFLSRSFSPEVPFWSVGLLWGFGEHLGSERRNLWLYREANGG